MPEYTRAQSVASFFSRVDIKGEGECWLWKGCTYNAGYGSFKWRGKMRGANRVAWEIANGQDIPEGMDVLHECDVPLCVNPNHLFLGTHAENMADAKRKGRHAHGEKGRAKLTELQVKQIIREFKWVSRKKTNADELAPIYGVDPGTIVAIGTGRTWKHVPRPMS